jgi:hypothetical protein
MRMTPESLLRDKLRKIEALYAGAGTDGERVAAKAAAERIRARLAELGKTDPPIEMRYSVADPWARQLFMALARRYGLKPYRYPRMQRQSIIIKAPRSFLETVLWPEFNELHTVLNEYLSSITDRIIREEVYGDVADAEEIDVKSLPRK